MWGFWEELTRVARNERLFRRRRGRKTRIRSCSLSGQRYSFVSKSHDDKREIM
jgi:hypothetical protein